DARIGRARFTGAADIVQLLPVLGELSGLPNAGGVDLRHPPRADRWGLFQGEKIEEASDAVYRRALDDVLLPSAASRMEQALRDARPDEVEYAYAALKAYLMLYDSAHYGPAFVQAVVDLEMERALPADFSSAQRSALRAHLGALFG
ncbi:ImcF-related family protein, partial [Burkholderia pseudomallei]|uniref:ImcF-related family protein n=1 Tax=Burkholderia pseudomallei TaxID=28450 RepID=UPI003CF4D6EB